MGRLADLDQRDDDQAWAAQLGPAYRVEQVATLLGITRQVVSHGVVCCASNSATATRPIPCFSSTVMRSCPASSKSCSNSPTRSPLPGRSLRGCKAPTPARAVGGPMRSSYAATLATSSLRPASGLRRLTADGASSRPASATVLERFHTSRPAAANCSTSWLALRTWRRSRGPGHPPRIRHPRARSRIACGFRG
jgi:hypothetical protein